MPDVGCVVVEKTRPGARVCAEPISMRKWTDLGAESALYPAGMAFTLPDDLAPEIYPLAWLVGTWRGYGILTYGETVPEQAVLQEITFDHDGGPYLRQTTTIWTVDATRSADLDFEMPGLEGASRLTPAQVWSTETTYWRPVGQEAPEPDGADAADGADAGKGAAPSTPVTRLELVSADPAGHVAVWEGWIQGPRAQVGTQAVGRTRTAADHRDDSHVRARQRRSHVDPGHGGLRSRGAADLRLGQARPGQ